MSDESRRAEGRVQGAAQDPPPIHGARLYVSIQPHLDEAERAACAGERAGEQGAATIASLISEIRGLVLLRDDAEERARKAQDALGRAPWLLKTSRRAERLSNAIASLRARAEKAEMQLRMQRDREATEKLLEPKVGPEPDPGEPLSRVLEFIERPMRYGYISATSARRVVAELRKAWAQAQSHLSERVLAEGKIANAEQFTRELQCSLDVLNSKLAKLEVESNARHVMAVASSELLRRVEAALDDEDVKGSSLVEKIERLKLRARSG